MSWKIGYRVMDGYTPDSTSTAYLDCDVDKCPHDVHTGDDKYTDERMAAFWDPVTEEWYETELPAHTCTDK